MCGVWSGDPMKRDIQGRGDLRADGKVPKMRGCGENSVGSETKSGGLLERESLGMGKRLRGGGKCGGVCACIVRWATADMFEKVITGTRTAGSVKHGIHHEYPKMFERYLFAMEFSIRVEIQRSGRRWN
jgi:hypothetical protein